MSRSAPTDKPCRASNDLWVRAAKQLPDEEKNIIGHSTPDKLSILAELHADAEKYKQISIDSRWTYTRKNGKTVILRDVIEKIVRWVDTFKQVGDVAVQYDPAHASLPWAAIRFVLQVAVEDINKFASVVEDLARIAELICRYAVTEALYLHGTSEAVVGLERALIKLYTVILEYLYKAKQYFKQGTAKRAIRSVVFANTQLEWGLTGISTAEVEVRQWKGLVDRNDTIRNYEELDGILKSIDEPLRRIDGSMKNIQDDLEVSKRAKILEWLSREPYMQHHKQATQGVLEKSGQWLLSDSTFKEWRDESASSILWLHGIPGSGKSKLVSIVIEDMLKRFKADGGSHPVFFYCSRNPAEPARSNPRAILASLARQLSSVGPGRPLLQPTLDLFQLREMETFASGQLQMDESCQLIMNLIELYPQTTIILDAMDECDHVTRLELLQLLEHILRDSSSLVKILISSRDDQDIVWHLGDYPNLEISSQRNSADIARFVKREVEKHILARKLLRHSRSQAEMKELIIENVVEGAAGMFRWASLQLQYLCEFKLDADIRTNLGRLPPSLQTLYMEIYDRLSSTPGKLESAIFRNVLLWLLCAQRTLRSDEFLAAISIDPMVGNFEDVVSKDLVLEICNNFVVFDSQLDTFRFAHLSVREFLEQRPDYSDSANNCLVAKSCLWAVLSMSKTVTTEELLLQLNWSTTAESVRAKDFLEYADTYWAVHCKFARHERSSDILKGALTTLLYNDNATSSVVLWAERLRTYFRDMDPLLARQYRDTMPCFNSAFSSALFISCIFDFDEQVEKIMSGYSTEERYMNKTGCSPLQVATRYGSLAILAALLLQDVHRIEVDEKVLIEAARLRSRQNALKILLDERGQEIRITEDVIRAAASNRFNGLEVMTFLLDHRGEEIYITEEIVKAVALNFACGKEIMALLLNRRRQEVRITNEVIEVLARLHGNGHEFMALLLDQRGKEVKISEEVVQAIAGNVGESVAMMTLLLETRGEEVQITEEVVKEAAGNPRTGLETMELLLNQRGEEVHITEHVMIAAAWNSTHGKNIIELLLDQRGEEIRITEEIVKAAARNISLGVELLRLLLDRRGEEVRVTEGVVNVVAGNHKIALEMMQFLLDQRGEEIYITEMILKTAAGNSRHGKNIIELLLDQRGEEVHITEEIVKAAANSNIGVEVLSLLLNRRGEEVQVTEGVVKATAKNFHNGKQALQFLLDQRGDEVQITEEVINTAAENNTEEMMAFLLNQCGNEVKITEKVIKAVARNRADSSMEIMRLLLDQRGEEIKITEEVVEVAARHMGNNLGLMTLLLDRRGGEIKITETVVKATARSHHYDRHMMKLLLDRRGEEVNITEEVVKEAAANPDGAVIQYLYEAMDISITDGVIESAATSGRLRTLRLFDQWSGTKIVSQHWVHIAQLRVAALEGNEKRVRELINQHIPPDTRDIYGTTPLWHAVVRGYIDIVRILLETNAVDVNVQSIRNRTPLSCAVKAGRVELVKLLLSHGARHKTA